MIVMLEKIKRSDINSVGRRCARRGALLSQNGLVLTC